MHRWETTKTEQHAGPPSRRGNIGNTYSKLERDDAHSGGERQMNQTFCAWYSALIQKWRKVGAETADPCDDNFIPTRTSRSEKQGSVGIGIGGRERLQETGEDDDKAG